MITRADWILTKNSVIQKTNHLLGSVQTEQNVLLQSYFSFFPGEIINSSHKISKGENYKGLPYLVLDYPRYFSKEDAFAIRTLFWWGNYFSITLQLSGHYLQMFAGNIMQQLKNSNREEYFLSVNESAWEHHFEPDNYISLQDYLAENSLQDFVNRPFIKIAKKIPLVKWDNAMVFYINNYNELLELTGEGLISQAME